MSIDDKFTEVMGFCQDWRTTSEVANFLGGYGYKRATTQAVLRRWEQAGALESLRDVTVPGNPPGNRYRTTAVAAAPGVLARAMRPKENRLAPPVPAASEHVRQHLPEMLFDARFTCDGVLINYDQFHRLIELLRITLDGSPNGQAH